MEEKEVLAQGELLKIKGKKNSRLIWVVGVIVTVIISVTLAWLNIKSDDNLDGRWKSFEYEQYMDERFDAFFEQLPLIYDVQLDKTDYYHGASSAIVIKGDDIRYETLMRFDLEGFAEDLYKENKALGSPKEIMESYLSSTTNMTYNQKEKVLRQNIFVGKLDKGKGLIKLTEKNQRSLTNVDKMTYKVKGNTLTVTANGFSHDFFRK